MDAVQPLTHVLRHFIALALLALATPISAATPAGKVVFSKGAVTLQAADGSGLRFVAKDEALHAGEVISTADKSFAVLELADQSRIVLRPETRFAVTQWEASQGKENALFDLFQGGLRAVTGLLSKRRPGAVSVRSATATIGIRGTDFAARVCDGDCADPLKQAEQASGVGRPESPVVARVVVTAGTVERIEGDGSRYPLIKGSPLYAGSLIETGKPGVAVIVFRDDTRISLAAVTRFQVERFQEQALADPGASTQATAPAFEPGVWLRLISGGLRAVTGTIAKTRPKAFRLSTPTATIGVRGTGFDLAYPVDCTESGGKGAGTQALATGVWEGTIAIQESNQDLSAGKSGCVDELGGPVVATREGPKVDAPRPDEVDVPAGLFTAETRSGSERGLHVSVFDGQVVISTDQGAVTLGRGEDGLAGSGASPVRYEAFSPVARVDAFSGIDPLGSSNDWNSIDPTTGGGAMCAP